MHCGNEALRKLARQQAAEYQQADKKQKSHISVELVAQVKAMSPAGRFLKRDPVSLIWQLVPDELAREKASQCLRDAVAMLKKRRTSGSSKSESSQKDENDSEEPLPISYRSALEPKRKATTPSADAQVVTSKKRCRTENTQNQDHHDENDDVSFSIPASVFAEIFEKPIYHHRVSIETPMSPAGATIVSEEQRHNYDFDLLNCDDDLLSSDLFVW